MRSVTIRTGERDLHGTGTALEGEARARVIHQHAPHELRREGEEMGAALPSCALLIGKPKPRFVNERRRLQRMSIALASQHAPRQPAKLGVDESHERVARVGVARAPGAQLLGDRLSGGRWRG